MTERIAATVPWKFKSAIMYLVNSEFYNSESDFIVTAIERLLTRDHNQHKFLWSIIEPDLEDLSARKEIKKNKEE